jgi:hypothetical protein
MSGQQGQLEKRLTVSAKTLLARNVKSKKWRPKFAQRSPVTLVPQLVNRQSAIAGDPCLSMRSTSAIGS